MQYLGSKKKLAKELLSIILKDRTEGQAYVEPFVGGANMIDKVEGRRIGNDSNKFLIGMWIALQNGWQPPETITQEEYTKIRLNKLEYPKELVCFVGFLCAFGGKWFGGYAKNSKGDNYALRGRRVLLKQIEKLKDVDFGCCDYSKLLVPENSIIYCDIPYANTTKYKDDFDHDKFWQWCREMSWRGHKLFISEYNAPADFKCVFEKEVKTVLNKNKQGDLRVEKLFTFN